VCESYSEQVLGFRVRPLTIRLPSRVEHTIKYEPPPGGKVSDWIVLVNRRRSDLADGAVRAKLAGCLWPVQVATFRPRYAVWSVKDDWCKKLAMFVTDYGETANVTICSGSPRAHGYNIRFTYRSVFAPIADNILFGALRPKAVSRRASSAILLLRANRPPIPPISQRQKLA